MLNAFGQTSFEGKINYDVRMAGESDAAKLILSFGINKIRLEFIVPGKTSDNDYEIIDLDSSKVYTMNVRDKSYESKALYKNRVMPVLPIKEIAGFRTTAIVQQRNTKQSEEEFLVSLNNGIFYIADDLHYSIPQVYAGNPQLMMVKNGKIVLGAEIGNEMQLDGQWNLNKTAGWGNEIIANVMATEILPMKMDPVIYIVPADYIEKGSKYLIDERVDYLKDSLDTIPFSVPQIAPKKKSSKPTKNKTTPTKQPGIHTKKD